MAMAGEESEKELGAILMQAMFAQKILRPQCDRLLELRRRQQQQVRPSDDDVAVGLRELALDLEHIKPAFAARLNDLAVMRMDFNVYIKYVDLAPDIFKAYFAGVRAGARSMATCLELAAKGGAHVARTPAFAAMPDEQLYDALVAQRLPARPTTKTEAFDRVEAAFYALKLSREHHLPRCVELLMGIRPPPLIDEPSDDSSEDNDDPVDAATEHVAPAPAAAANGESPLAALRRSVDYDKASDYLDRACTLWSLAVEHIDLAVLVISSFLDTKEVASLSDYTDRVAYDTALRTDRMHSF